MPAPKPTQKTAEMGRLLAELRDERGLTQKEVGLRLGIVEQTYRNYEKGAARIPLSDVGRWARALDVSIELLLSRLGVLTKPPRAFDAMAAELIDHPALGSMLLKIARGYDRADDEDRWMIEQLLDALAERYGGWVRPDAIPQLA